MSDKNSSQMTPSRDVTGRPRNSVRNRLLFSFVIVALISTIILTAITVYQQFQNSQKNALDKLEAIASLKEDEINTWVNSLQSTVKTIAVNKNLNQEMTTVLSQTPLTGPDQPMTEDQMTLKDQLTSFKDQNNYFDDFFITDLNGNVLISTDPSANNLSRIRGDWSSFKGAILKPFNSPIIRGTSNVYESSSSLISAVPIMGNDNQTIGILAGRASVITLYQILSKLSGLGTTGETYLVGTDEKMVTATRFMAWKPFYYMTSDAVKNGLNKVSGSKAYLDYQNVPVFGVYHWVAGLQVVLIAEVQQSEAYAPALLTMRTNLLAALLAILLAAIGSVFVANGIALPIKDLVRVANQITAGNLNLKAPVRRNDEVGELAQAFNSMTDQLKFLILDLEQRVNARTVELERRAVQLRAAGEVARDITMAEDLTELLNRSVNLIRDRFGYYHAGIFLADEQQEYAVLKAATGDAGHLMVEQGHKLKIGEVGIVGNVIGSGTPRIAMDIGEDAYHFKNPLLPETHSEMALPLKVAGQIIGALDVQSQLISAFSKDDIDTLQTMADQLAVAIQRARLVQQLEDNLHELEATYQSYTKEAWHDFLTRSRKTYHLRYHQSQIEQGTSHSPETKEAMSRNQTILREVEMGDQSGINSTALAVPIHLRGHILGVVTLHFQSDKVNPDLVSLIENIANRLALSLDNARLLMEIRHRAEREHRVTEITSKVRATTDIDKILRIAIEELGQVIDVSGAMIQLRTDESREEIA